MITRQLINAWCVLKLPPGNLKRRDDNFTDNHNKIESDNSCVFN